MSCCTHRKLVLVLAKTQYAVELARALGDCKHGYDALRELRRRIRCGVRFDSHVYFDAPGSRKVT